MIKPLTPKGELLCIMKNPHSLWVPPLGVRGSTSLYTLLEFLTTAKAFTSDNYWDYNGKGSTSMRCKGRLPILKNKINNIGKKLIPAITR